MIQERQQTLADELSKSAYNAALSGVEDAKRAIMYCNSQADRDECNDALYRSTCPGFNGSDYFSRPGRPGISPSINGQTSLVINESDTSVQGYSCVIVSNTTDTLKGSLSASQSNGGALFELQTDRPLTRIVVEWHNTPLVTSTPYDAGTFVNNVAGYGGNPRQGDMNSHPAALRLMTFGVPKSGFSLDQVRVTQKSHFIYPTRTNPTGNSPILSISDTSRYERACTLTNAASSGYACSAEVTFPAEPTPGNPITYTPYIMLNALYSDTNFQIKAYDRDGNPVSFRGVQMTIDSTGYASGVSRRVLVNVRTGGDSFTSASALDTGLGLCKNFTANATGFSVNNAGDCEPL